MYHGRALKINLVKHFHRFFTNGSNFQGSRLTAFELVHDKIPATLIADSAAAALMNNGQVQAVIVGADRIAANGNHPQ